MEYPHGQGHKGETVMDVKEVLDKLFPQHEELVSVLRHLDARVTALENARAHSDPPPPVDPDPPK